MGARDAVAGPHWEILLWALLLFRYVYPGHAVTCRQSLWRDLIGRLEREVPSPDPNARFRGSLVDDKMFAIDVKEWGLDNLLEERRERCVQISLEDEENCAWRLVAPLRRQRP